MCVDNKLLICVGFISTCKNNIHCMETELLIVSLLEARSWTLSGDWTPDGRSAWSAECSVILLLFVLSLLLIKCLHMLADDFNYVLWLHGHCAVHSVWVFVVIKVCCGRFCFVRFYALLTCFVTRAGFVVSDLMHCPHILSPRHVLLCQIWCTSYTFCHYGMFCH